MKINSNFVGHAKTVIASDGKQFKNQHPEYANDPSSEIMKSLGILKDKSSWKERYYDFVENMVYTPQSALNYEKTISIIAELSMSIIKTN